MFSDVDLQGLTLEEKSEGGRSLQTIRDKAEDLLIQSPWLDLNNSGIPQKNEFFKSDKDSRFTKVSLHLSCFFDWLRLFDKQVQTLAEKRKTTYP